jgi:hypothetical protein
MAAQLTAILIDHGIDASWWDDDPDRRSLVDVPIYNGRANGIRWRFNYHPENVWDGRSILRTALDNFATKFGISRLRMSRKTVPVKYLDIPKLHGVDVAICSICGSWSKYRQYPSMDTVKAELTNHGISWTDMTATNMRGNDVLNLARKSRLYLGLDTGMTHYVASVVRRGLILQSGYSTPAYWAATYPFEFLQVSVPCCNCFLTSGCQDGHKCMTALTPTRVVHRIQAILKGS